MKKDKSKYVSRDGQVMLYEPDEPVAAPTPGVTQTLIPKESVEGMDREMIENLLKGRK